MRATAIAHPIQGLVKYHGLKNPKQRIPFHDSISVCIDALYTITTVEVNSSLKGNIIVINEKWVTGQDKKRVGIVLDKLKKLAEYLGFFKIVSRNSIKTGKGLGFSASGFAALGAAASKALSLDLDYVSLSEIVRLGAGSATRSLAGGFALWYADKNGHSYAEQLSSPDNPSFSMIIVPIHSKMKTDEAHAEVVSSPLFQARLVNIDRLIETMKSAIMKGDTATIGRIAEEDTLNLHAITMTGKSHLVLWEPDTIRLIREVNKLRNSGVECWYSIDTGPSVFVNTFQRHISAVADRLVELGFSDVIISGVGGKPKLTDRHLF
ncbi:MAG: diphosphomevalonate decarboxylase [Candidatus Bathyarchaeota archaeon]|nr:diphosphomevalonate decarboxylase [Candidatus Bathyarchaeota archaeon]MDH5494483.1 diphosphomevalonate decarboxylase [Candidatus Bathyarchaeota archaeon]